MKDIEERVLRVGFKTKMFVSEFLFSAKSMYLCKQEAFHLTLSSTVMTLNAIFKCIVFYDRYTCVNSNT
jgi:hypothetical protein